MALVGGGSQRLEYPASAISGIFSVTSTHDWLNNCSMASPRAPKTKAIVASRAEKRRQFTSSDCFDGYRKKMEIFQAAKKVEWQRPDPNRLKAELQTLRNLTRTICKTFGVPPLGGSLSCADSFNPNYDLTILDHPSLCHIQALDIAAKTLELFRFPAAQ